MTFTLYPDPPMHGLVVPAGTTVFTSFAACSAPVAEFDPPYAQVMFLRAAMFGGASPPNLFLGAGNGTPVEVSVDPQGVFRSPGDIGYVGDVSLKAISPNAIEVMVGLVSVDPALVWRLGICNTDPAQRSFTWAVADNQADTVQPWVDPTLVDHEATTLIPVGVTPIHVAFDPAHEMVYAAGYDSSLVAIIDLPGRTVSPNTIRVGQRPFKIAINSEASRAYVANSEDSTISVVDTVGRSVIKTITDAPEVVSLAIDPAKRTLYAGCSLLSGNAVVGAVLLYDTDTHSLAGTIQVPHRPFGLAIDPVTHTVYATDGQSNAISAIDADKHTVNQIVVGKPTHDVAVDAVSRGVYLSCSNDKAVLAVDPYNHAVTTIAVADAPGGLAIDSRGRTLYLTHNGGTTASVIDLRTGDEEIVKVGFLPSAVTVDPLAQIAVTADRKSRTVSVIERRPR
jgi:YVTN family beta-propeller protein